MYISMNARIFDIEYVRKKKPRKNRRNDSKKNWKNKKKEKIIGTRCVATPRIFSISFIHNDNTEKTEEVKRIPLQSNPGQNHREYYACVRVCAAHSTYSSHCGAASKDNILLFFSHVKRTAKNDTTNTYRCANRQWAMNINQTDLVFWLASTFLSSSRKKKQINTVHIHHIHH